MKRTVIAVAIILVIVGGFNLVGSMQASPIEETIQAAKSYMQVSPIENVIDKAKELF